MVPRSLVMVNRDWNLNNYIETAVAAGCPQDQVQRFGDAAYIAQPKQLIFHSLARKCDLHLGPTHILMGGARGGAKSHTVMGQMGIDDCQRRENLKCLFLRKVQRSAKESLHDQVRRVLYGVPHDLVENEVRFPNGSKILLGGFNNESDIDRYIGIEYDVLGLEEATQLSEYKFTLLRGSIRTSRSDWRTRLYLTTNPGGIGHLWCYENFVKPFERRRDHFFLGGLTRFIPSTYRDNRFLDQEYIDYLLALEGPLGLAWREGLWTAFEGMAFPQWDENIHVIDPIDIPKKWIKWRAIDWGYANPFCCLWLARDPDSNRVYIYRELYQTELTTRQQARMILEMTPPQEAIKFTYADPSMWARQNRQGEVFTTAEEYNSQGVPLTKGDNDRLSGKRKVDRLLANLGDGRPGVQIFSSCINLIRTLPALPLAKRQDQIMEDVDTKAEDHAYDAFRYGVSNIRIQTDPVNKRDQVSPLAQQILRSSRL